MNLTKEQKDRIEQVKKAADAYAVFSDERGILSGGITSLLSIIDGLDKRLDETTNLFQKREEELLDVVTALQARLEKVREAANKRLCSGHDVDCVGSTLSDCACGHNRLAEAIKEGE